MASTRGLAAILAADVAIYRRGARLCAADPIQPRPRADGKPIRRRQRAADAARGILDPAAPRLARMADPLHLGRLCRLHLACADRAAVDDAAAAAPADPGLRIPGLGAQCTGRSAGGDQPRHFRRRQDDRRDVARPADRAGSAETGAGRVPRAHRRRGRRHEVGGAAAAQGFPAAPRSALARIQPDRARRGMVDPDPGLRRGRRRAL